MDRADEAEDQAADPSHLCRHALRRPSNGLTTLLPQPHLRTRLHPPTRLPISLPASRPPTITPSLSSSRKRTPSAELPTLHQACSTSARRCSGLMRPHGPRWAERTGRLRLGFTAERGRLARTRRRMEEGLPQRGTRLTSRTQAPVPLIDSRDRTVRDPAPTAGTATASTRERGVGRAGMVRARVREARDRWVGTPVQEAPGEACIGWTACYSSGACVSP